MTLNTDKDIKMNFDFLFYNGIDFFEPKKSIIDYLIQHHSESKIAEIGCGRGLFLKHMVDANLKAIGIDIYPKTNSHIDSNIIIMDALNFNYNQVDVAIVARPCHGYFVYELFKKLIPFQFHFFYYIGLEKNFDIDIDTDEYQFEIILDDVGKENEKLLKITKINQIGRDKLNIEKIDDFSVDF